MLFSFCRPLYLRHFTLEKAKATGVINGGIISGIYLLTCATAEGAWTGTVGCGIAGAVGGDVVLPLGTVPGYVGGAILGGIGALQTEVGI
ncbi:hypothetical protein [Streptococcus mutans]|uniref:hypothetical protein n=1 Tax=Streptococcus mutans TaxID=1309 RepID=UPI0002B55EAE|nr:hypothetical protein [Streptococcus mutans]EMB57784.1 hypothetical protein SMU10_08878 [Streptococcus mutans 8ID3]EMB78078.1 hypothetical protein SMU52_09844 [Streptococcus mutans NFSM2]EMB87824.1 hypothetical protein SMU58_09942 [Streptococcus mutans A19]EMB91193.1 hypothetical protein SMU60_09820 [Streptococcus mutans U138]EMC11027.1 hypothetical protein SMU76_10067 [Streptococcus mutans N66]